MHLHDAYVLAGEGDGLVGEGRLDEAAACYVRAHEASPNNPELSFWAGLSLVAQGDENGGIALLREAIATHPGWLELLRRLSAKAGPGVERARILLGATSKETPPGRERGV
jgi:tetratricopeptide (TPR) repeat protein